MQNEIEGLLTVKEVAQMLNLCEMSVWRAAWRGEIESIKFRRARRFRPVVIRELMKTGIPTKTA